MLWRNTVREFRFLRAVKVITLAGGIKMFNFIFLDGTFYLPEPYLFIILLRLILLWLAITLTGNNL